MEFFKIVNTFQVKIWFQNRRNKWKRQIAADSEASNLRAFPGVPLFLQVLMYICKNRLVRIIYKHHASSSTYLLVR